MTAEKKAIQAQLDLSQAQYDKLTNDIAVNKKKLADNQNALGGIIADLYVDGKVSPLEMLASSKNVGEYMDKHEYQSSVSERLTETINAIRTLKAQLEKDQKSVEKVLADQKAQRETLAAKEAEQQRLLDQTKNDEAAYQQQVTSSKAQMSQIAAQQRAALAAATNGGRNNAGSVGSFQFRNYSGNSSCGGGGYPLCGAQDSYADQWGLYNRECVSYTAWAAYNRFGKQVMNFSGAGNAYQWPSTTTRMGANTDKTPEVGSVAILPRTSGFADIGHSMMVEAVLGGGWVHVSQYNFGGTGEYSTMDIHVSGVNFVHFRDR
jgi:surface antigen